MPEPIKVEFRKLQESPTLPVRMWVADSASTPGIQHIVMKLPNGTIICTCVAGQLQRNCWHIKKAETL